MASFSIPEDLVPEPWDSLADNRTMTETELLVLLRDVVARA